MRHRPRPIDSDKDSWSMSSYFLALKICCKVTQLDASFCIIVVEYGPLLDSIRVFIDPIVSRLSYSLLDLCVKV